MWKGSISVSILESLSGKAFPYFFLSVEVIALMLIVLGDLPFPYACSMRIFKVCWCCYFIIWVAAAKLNLIGLTFKFTLLFSIIFLGEPCPVWLTLVWGALIKERWLLVVTAFLITLSFYCDEPYTADGFDESMLWIIECYGYCFVLCELSLKVLFVKECFMTIKCWVCGCCLFLEARSGFFSFCA